ncbi:MAG: response regulator [Candidatus Delongbacteria bacterium]|nr:response regulator [Candidatus Delongbacteria bacterium]MBN2836762.1 response regulator [Candidatus Delongbacteria bacterium]
MSAKNVLILDDEKEIAELIKEFIEILNHKVVTFSDPFEALQHIKDSITVGERFDLVFTDFFMPKMEGDKFSEEVFKIDSNIDIYLLSGRHSDELKQFQKNSIKGFINKPFRIEDFERILGDE